MIDELKQKKPHDVHPSLERQAELEAAYQKNVDAKEPPYNGVHIKTLDELEWIMHQRQWTGEPELSQGESRADFRGAVFIGTNLFGAKLRWANFCGADLYKANLSGIKLNHAKFNTETNLADVQLSNGDIGLMDVSWGGVSLVRINWEPVQVLGNERSALRYVDRNGKPKDDQQRLTDWINAVRAYRLLATALRDQGMNEESDRFTYRARICQQHVFRYQR